MVFIILLVNMSVILYFIQEVYFTAEEMNMY